MTSKTWTATDLKLGKFSIVRQGDVFYVQQRYSFVDSEGALLEQITGGHISFEISAMEIPSDILTSLQTIDSWTKQKALEQEGMNDS